MDLMENSLNESNKSIETNQIWRKLDDALTLLDDVENEINLCEYSLSDNQVQFVMDVLGNSLEIDYGYSGRGMFGRCCPCVVIDGYGEQFSTTADTRQDNLGLQKVIYARD